MEIIIAQILVMFLFLVSALLSTATPVLLSHRRNDHVLSQHRCQTIIGGCNSIGGGVLLATCFVALLPLVEQSYHIALSSVETKLLEQPVAEITILSGFFLVIFIEQAVTSSRRRHSDKHKSRSDSPEEEALFSEADDSRDAEHLHSSTGHSANQLAATKSLLRSVILVITLGIHTLFEGMAIGLIHDLHILVPLTLAVMLHHLCCAVALGVNIAQQSISKKSALIVCLIFSVMMPSGIALGLALGQVNGFGGLLLTAILQGIATGTFIYVLFMEIIPNISSTPNALLQMVLLLFGCFFMTLIICLSHDSSGHSSLQGNVTIPSFYNVSV